MTQRKGEDYSEATKKETKLTATAKASFKTASVEKDKPKEPTGYAAQYFQKQAATSEHSSSIKPINKEMLTAGIIIMLMMIYRPLLSLSTRER